MVQVLGALFLALGASASKSSFIALPSRRLQWPQGTAAFLPEAPALVDQDELEEFNTTRKLTSLLTVDSSNWGFVQASGTSFSVNGQSWYPVGTNAFYAAQVDIMSQADVVYLFKVRPLYNRRF